MKKDYTNANKRFYDKSPSESKKGRKEKKLRAKALALIYIFNNLKEYEELVEKLLEVEKRFIELEENSNPFAYIHDELFGKSFLYFSIIKEGSFVSYYKLEDEVNFFFRNFKKDYQISIYNEINSIFDIFLKAKKFSRRLFVKYLLNEFKENNYLKKNQNNFDFDTLLEIAMEHKEVLEIASKKNKEEILDILEFVKD